MIFLQSDYGMRVNGNKKALPPVDSKASRVKFSGKSRADGRLVSATAEIAAARASSVRKSASAAVRAFDCNGCGSLPL